MEFVHVSITDGIAEARLKRGKVNALSEPAVEEIADCLRSLAADLDTRAVILTGDGAFFSFGFDIPEFLGYSRESFAKFLQRFTALRMSDIVRESSMFPGSYNASDWRWGPCGFIACARIQQDSRDFAAPQE